MTELIEQAVEVTIDRVLNGRVNTEHASYIEVGLRQGLEVLAADGPKMILPGGEVVNVEYFASGVPGFTTITYDADESAHPELVALYRLVTDDKEGKIRK